MRRRAIFLAILCSSSPAAYAQGAPRTAPMGASPSVASLIANGFEIRAVTPTSGYSNVNIVYLQKKTEAFVCLNLASVTGADIGNLVVRFPDIKAPCTPLK